MQQETKRDWTEHWLSFMERLLEFTACLAVLAFLVVQLMYSMLTCAVARSVAWALPAHCRAGMRQWAFCVWQHAFSVEAGRAGWKSWLGCHPAEAWLVSVAAA